MATAQQKAAQTVSIDEFVSGLQKLTEKDFTGVEGALEYIRSKHIDPETLTPYLFWNAQHYTRNLIDKTDLYELLSLCWEPGMKSSIHNHKGQNCWMAAPMGRLLVQNYKLLEEDLAAHHCNISRPTATSSPSQSCRSRSAESGTRRQQPARMERARRQPARVLAPIRFMHRVFGRPVYLRRDWTAVHVEVREAVLKGSN